MDDSAIDKTISSAVAAGLGVIMVCAFVIPIVTKMLGQIQDIGLSSGDLATYSTLIGLVVIMTIIGLIIAVIRGFSLSSNR